MKISDIRAQVSQHPILAGVLYAGTAVGGSMAAAYADVTHHPAAYSDGVVDAQGNTRLNAINPEKNDALTVCKADAQSPTDCYTVHIASVQADKAGLKIAFQGPSGTQEATCPTVHHFNKGGGHDTAECRLAALSAAQRSQAAPGETPPSQAPIVQR